MYKDVAGRFNQICSVNREKELWDRLEPSWDGCERPSGSRAGGSRLGLKAPLDCCGVRDGPSWKTTMPLSGRIGDPSASLGMPGPVNMAIESR